jgi:hypothetical protein
MPALTRQALWRSRNPLLSSAIHRILQRHPQAATSSSLTWGNKSSDGCGVQAAGADRLGDGRALASAVIDVAVAEAEVPDRIEETKQAPAAG